MARKTKEGFVWVRGVNPNGVEDGRGGEIRQGQEVQVPRATAMVHLETGAVVLVQEEAPAFDATELSAERTLDTAAPPPAPRRDDAPPAEDVVIEPSGELSRTDEAPPAPEAR